MTIEDYSEQAITDLISLNGRVAVVTGAAVGIGRAIAARLAEAGATVVLADLDHDGAKAAAAAVDPVGVMAHGAHLDVTDSEASAVLAATTVERHGGLDIWVNNAGVYPSKPFLEMSDADWSGVLDVNLNGAFSGSRAAARQMVERDTGGVILNIASVSGYRGRKGLAHYSTSKHGLRGLTRSLAVELGPYDIRVLALAPTMTLTAGVSAAAAAITPDSTTQHSTAIYEQLPLGRAAVPDDIARVALFCVSDLAALMTGTTLPVDAGQMSM
jgi:NAD(P)-dependent dehydrogenase (short-subunit alcohol dehydrogenase family)